MRWRGTAAPGDSPEAATVLPAALTDDEAAAVAAASNDFGFALHREVAATGETTVTSPLSASILLSMVAAGAGGETAEAMTEVLGLDGPRDPRPAALLAALTDASDVTLEVADALWANAGTDLEADYLAFVRDTLGATVEEAPLGQQATADAIDAWVADHTGGHIDGIASELGLPNPQAVLVLLDAVHFQGEWTIAFDPDDTVDAPFTLEDGTEVAVPTMRRLDDDLALELVERDDFLMVRLPYGDTGRFGMEIVLPYGDTSLDELLVDLDAEAWREAVDALAREPVGMLTLPRMELTWDAELTAALSALGMGRAFGPDADFRPMSPASPTLDTVVQKTYLRVDEVGTEAAAVTGGVMDVSAPVGVSIDRPFAFTISDQETGAILFLGTAHDPRGHAS